MNQTVYFKYFVLLSLFIGLPIEAKLLKPSKDGEKKEILLINGKRRLYYPVETKGLTYSLSVAALCLFIISGSVVIVGIKSKKNIKKHLTQHEPDSLL